MFKEYLPQPDGYPHAHCATLVEFHEKLYCVWYVYPEEEHQDARMAISSFNSTLKRWTTAKLLLEGPGQSQGNPTPFVYGDKLYLLYVTLKSIYWNSAVLQLAEINPKSLKANYLWSYGLPEGTMIRHRPLIMGQKILIPAYYEKEKQTVILESQAPFKEIRPISTLDSGPIQGDLIKDTNQNLTLVLRGTGDTRKIVRAHSVDGGKSWPYVFRTPFECPLSGVAAHKDDNGNIFLLHNNTPEHKRTPLSLTTSKDQLKSMHKTIPVEFGEGEYSYPNLLRDSKGDLHLVYTHNRDKIGHY